MNDYTKILSLILFFFVLPPLFFFYFITVLKIMAFKGTLQNVIGNIKYDELTKNDKWNGNLLWYQLPYKKVIISDELNAILDNSMLYKKYLFYFKCYKVITFVFIAFFLVIIIVDKFL